VVCPENIPLVDQVLEFRRALVLFADNTTARPGKTASKASSDSVFLADSTLSARPELLDRISALLNCAVASDNTDITLALESGQPLARERKASFIETLRNARTVISSDGLLTRHLRQWIARTSVLSLGQALSALPSVRKSLGPDDLYVIEPRAYHSNYATLVRHYDALRRETGCMLNLDLQRVAIPARARGLAKTRRNNHGTGTSALAQAEWLLKGRKPKRIVVEDLNDMDVLKQASNLPVLHVADIVQR
jgi:hypothetical protein